MVLSNTERHRPIMDFWLSQFNFQLIFTVFLFLEFVCLDAKKIWYFCITFYQEKKKNKLEIFEKNLIWPTSNKILERKEFFIRNQWNKIKMFKYKLIEIVTQINLIKYFRYCLVVYINSRILKGERETERGEKIIKKN